MNKVLLVFVVTTTLFLTGLGNKFLSKKVEEPKASSTTAKMETIQVQEVFETNSQVAQATEVQDSPVIEPTFAGVTETVPAQPVVTADVKPVETKPAPVYYRRRFFFR
jgi:hypothetical protein